MKDRRTSPNVVSVGDVEDSFEVLEVGDVSIITLSETGDEHEEPYPGCRLAERLVSLPEST